ncbi:nitrophorin-1-like [Rhodnius prolixus]|uniref:nitrophorin-1-like n=1 Tax=Rhodnius prolixus TaxID=13249 RepID=UPI003D18BC22
MKSSIALVLAAVTFWQLAAERETAACTSSVTATTKLNKDKYFKDGWYATHFKAVQVPTKHSATASKYCAYTVGKVNGNKVTEVLSHYNSKTQSSIFDISKVTVSGGKYTANYRRVDKDGQDKGQSGTYTVTVLDTDHDNYAITHLCVTRGDDVFEFYTIANRQKDGTHAGVSSGLSSASLTLTDFTSSKDLGCNYEEEKAKKLLTK